MTELRLDSITAPHRIEKRRGTAIVLRILLFAGLVLVCVGGFFVVSFLFWAQCLDFHAFRSPSASMCPAICEGERFIAGMDAFDHRALRRGDVILFDHDESGTKYVKRVIGLAGDTVARGPANTLLVNSKPMTLPAPCGENNSYRGLAGWGLPFETLTVPQGSVFVIGDNLDNSFDSRMFGPVRLDKVKGKVLLIYWSPNRSRIGCRIH